MKELSIEEKAKAYDEALAKAAKIHRNYKGRVRAVDVVIEEVFPELKESEDERIRQFLIQEITETSDEIMSYRNMNKKDVLAWLEKQGNANKEYWRGYSEGKQEILDKYTELEKQGEQKPTWSEEDEIGLVNALWCCKQAASIAKDENDMGNVWYAERWLKSLKDRCTWKPSDDV